MKGRYSGPAGWRSAKQTAFFTAQLGMVKNGPPFSPRSPERCKTGRLFDLDGVLAYKTDRLFDPDGVLACKTGRLFDPDGVLAYKTGRLFDPDGVLAYKTDRLFDPDGVLACKTDRLFDPDGVLACKTDRLLGPDGVLAYKTGAKRSDVRLISPRSPRPAKLGCPCRFTLNATFAHPFRTG